MRYSLRQFALPFVVLVAIFLTVKIFVQPHWPSLGGLTGLALFVTIATGLITAWGCRDNSWSVRITIGLAFALFAATSLLLSIYLNVYASAALFLVVLYIDQRTKKFFERRDL